ncbi:unnamed protein product [Klebsiella pneumoniae]|nr:hypothetical protein HMPREF3197_00825 [Klebsiella pneumoniae]CDQ53081.1 unnamed protein product [Klebsiella pneumoniae]
MFITLRHPVYRSSLVPWLNNLAWLIKTFCCDPAASSPCQDRCSGIVLISQAP